jgi:hypothetical protein
VTATRELLDGIRDLRMRNEGLVWKGHEQETIILKKNVGDEKAWVRYEDDDCSKRLRKEVKLINARLLTIDLQLESTDGRVYDLSNPLVRRQFSNNSFFHDGRLFGEFQNLPKNQRPGLRLQGEEVAGVDFISMNAQLLYAIDGKAPPVGDLYAFEGFEGHRAFAKIFFNALLFSREPLRAFPRDKDAPRPKGLKLGKAVEAVKKLHPDIAYRFCTGVGYKLTYLESNILIRALMKCRDKGLAAIPLHDAMLVPKSKALVAQSILKEAFREELGRDQPVSVAISKPPSIALVKLSQLCLALSRHQPGLKMYLGHGLLPESDIPEITHPGWPRDVVFEARNAKANSLWYPP